MASDIGGILSNIYTPLITIGDVSVRMACGNFIANILGIEASAPAGSTSQTGLVASRIDNSAPPGAGDHRPVGHPDHQHQHRRPRDEHRG